MSASGQPQGTEGPVPFAGPPPRPVQTLRAHFARRPHFSPYLDPDAWLDFFDEQANRFSSTLALAVVVNIAILLALSVTYTPPVTKVDPPPLRVEIITLEPAIEEPEPAVIEPAPVAPPPPAPRPRPQPRPQPAPPPPPPEPEPEPEPVPEVAPPPPQPEILTSELPDPLPTPEPEPIPEPLPEPVLELPPEPLPEPIVEPAPEPVTVDPLPKLPPEPIVVEPEPVVIEPLPDPVPEPVVEPEPLPEPEPNIVEPLPEPVIEEPAPVVTPDPVPVPVEPLPVVPEPVIVETPEPAPEPPNEIVTTAPTILASPEAPTTQEEADRAVPQEQAAPLSDLITGRNQLPLGNLPPAGLPANPDIAGPSRGGGNIEGGTRLANPGAGGWTLTAPQSPGGGYGTLLEDVRCREATRTHEDCPQDVRGPRGRDAMGFERYSEPRHGGATGLGPGARARAGDLSTGDIGATGEQFWNKGFGTVLSSHGPSTTVLDDVDFSKEFLGSPVIVSEPGGRVRDLFDDTEVEDDWTLELIIEEDE